MKNRLICVLLFLFILTFSVSAHSGKTDENGGHYDGPEYHYHHGYAAHQHPNGNCPYDFDKEFYLIDNYSETTSKYSESYYEDKIVGLEDEVSSLESALSKVQKKASYRFDIIVGLCILLIIATFSSLSYKKIANSMKQDSINYSLLLKEYRKQSEELEQLKKEKQNEDNF